MRSAVLVALVALLLPSLAHGHGMTTGALEVIETTPGSALATWETTVDAPRVLPVFPESCEVHAIQTNAWRLACERPLAGSRFAIEGLGPVLSEAVVRIALANGEAASAVLVPERSVFVVPSDARGAGVLVEYARQGLAHIAVGADHLLFLLGLVLVLRRPKAVLLAETAFTISHSATYSATALGWLSVSGAWAETLIAVSLVLVALDAGRAPKARHGIAAAFLFGLVHGLGFAGSLADVGLPRAAVAEALLGFALGVEVGQIAFLALVLGVFALVERTRAAPVLRLASIYAVGITGAFWFFQRLGGLT